MELISPATHSIWWQYSFGRVDNIQHLGSNAALEQEDTFIYSNGTLVVMLNNKDCTQVFSILSFLLQIAQDSQ
jgi:hypothetical protein